MKFCLNCNIEIPNRNKYCSVECQKEYQYKEYIDRWKNGKEKGIRGDYQISMHIKTYLLRKYNFKCAKCNWNKVNKYTGKIPLEIEHIDGNYMNNKEENLMVLCPNCYSLTIHIKEQI